MKKLLMLTAVLEVLTGVIVLALPLLALRALFGVEILDVDGMAIIVSRVAGIALIGFGVACWPGSVPQVRAPRLGANLGDNRQQAYGMLAYSILVMLYLLRIGIRGAPAGILLWPAVIVHAILIVLLVLAGMKARKASTT